VKRVLGAFKMQIRQNKLSLIITVKYHNNILYTIHMHVRSKKPIIMQYVILDINIYE
jgi:hypothetical protein